MNACHIWWFIWGREKGKGGRHFKGSLHTQPLVLNAYATESIKVEEEMERVLPFYNEKRPVGIYYSLSSAIFDSVEYLNVVKDIYKAFYFNDVNLSFITERMLKSGDIKTSGLKLLIFPNARYCDPETLKAVEKLEKQGVAVLFIGKENLTRNTLDEHNPKLNLENASQWPLGGNWKEYSERSGEMMKKAGIKRTYTIKMQDAAKLKTVEARFAKLNGKDIGYAVNLGKSSRTFSLVSSVDGKKLRVKNIVTKEIYDQINLGPMEYISFDIKDAK
jgi:hypothetical protein